MKRQEPYLPINTAPSSANINLALSHRIVKSHDKYFFAGVKGDYNLINTLPTTSDERINDVILGAAFSGNKELLATLFQKYPNAKLNIAVEGAVYGDHIPLVMFLINEGASTLVAVEAAACNNNIQLLYTLFKSGGDVAIDYAVRGAAKGGHIELTLKLLKDYNTHAGHYSMAIYVAACENHDILVKKLLLLERHDDPTKLVKGAVEGNHRKLLFDYLNRRLGTDLSEAAYKLCLKTSIEEVISKENNELLPELLEMPDAPPPSIQAIKAINDRNDVKMTLSILKKFPLYMTDKPLSHFVINNINYYYFNNNPYYYMNFFYYKFDEQYIDNCLAKFIIYKRLTPLALKAKDVITDVRKSDEMKNNYTSEELFFLAREKVIIEYEDRQTLSPISIEICTLYKIINERYKNNFPQEIWYQIIKCRALIDNDAPVVLFDNMSQRIFKLWKEKICSSEPDMLQVV